MLKNLRYRVQRLFNGESGVVESVEIADGIIYGSDGEVLEKHNYCKDDFAGLPKKVRFRNPLGKIQTGLSSTVLVIVETFKMRSPESRRQYKTYEIGDKFP